MNKHVHSVAAVVIGRNEGERLTRCLTSLRGRADPIIYVDSGSTDGSAENATKLGAKVVMLDTTIPFTAARARNAGLRHLTDSGLDQGLVQFVDGDCEVEPGWIDIARDALASDPQLAIVAGRRRERFPEASVYNRLCDAEWDTPIGPAEAVGGDMMARLDALAAIGGFRDDMIAGEEPEMCLRLARAGWRIARLDAPMTLHDADIHRFGQWWRRARRAGHAFAEGNWLHGSKTEAFWQHEVRRAILWGAVIPLIFLVAAIFQGAWALLILLVYPFQIARLAGRLGWSRSLFLTLAKFPEAQGIIEFYLRQLIGRKRRLIEYK
ncbi:glycosyltransferase [Paracoccus tegillarcae]|uniref:Glycosyl transferase n=1 Tax=Paracoccus tegillarcae TaxID=1529068 RepID=A0A2K9ETW5_9RHOB|nr:glycosyltransferase [Paracoccus tegillarcae]AUH34296.1 glycosyl transferase [Paracoccus tegillarcae]